MTETMDAPVATASSTPNHDGPIGRAAKSVREVDDNLRGSLGAGGGAISTGLAGAGVGLAVGEIPGAVIGAIVGALVGWAGLRSPSHSR